MTPEQQIRALAELDGFTRSEQHDFDAWADYPPGVDCTQRFYERIGNLTEQRELKYLSSYDAILPLVKKQPISVQQLTCELLQRQQWFYILCTPSQLCEALLRATGKWIESK